MTDLLENPKVARDRANEMFRGMDSKMVGVTASSMLADKQQVLQQIDRTFELEVSFLSSMQGAGGEKRLLAKMFMTILNPFRVVTTAECLRRMGDILGSELYKFCGNGAQGHARALRGMVNDLHMRIGCRMIEPASGETPAKTLVGAAAVNRTFETARALVSGGAPYNLDSLSFAKFHWLMSQEQVASLAEWTKSLLDGSDAAAPAMVEPAPVAQRGLNAAGKAKAKVASSEAQVLASVNDLSA